MRFLLLIPLFSSLLSVGTHRSLPAENFAFRVEAVVVPISCAEANDGQLSLRLFDGAPPYTYDWSNGASGESISNLAPGPYGVTVTDAGGVEASAQVELTAPEVLGATAEITRAGCRYDGAIDLTPLGGTPPYSFNWGNNNFNEDIEHLAEGTFSVTITDARGCSDVFSFFVPGPDLSITLVPTDASCTTATDGSILIDNRGTDGPFTYQWSNGSTDETLSDVAPGDYGVTVTDRSGCQESAETTIGSTTELILSLVANSSSCENDGSIDLTVEGGDGPYAFDWNNGSAVEDPADLAPGDYSVTVFDANGCTAFGRTTVGSTAFGLTLSATAPSCEGIFDGRIEAIAPGAIPPLVYSWSNGSNEPTLTDLPPGSYQLSLTDARGCEAFASVELDYQYSVRLTAQVENADCGDTGSITMDATGGRPPYAYAWSNGMNGSSLTGLSAGVYTVTATDGGGCTAVENYTLSAGPPILPFIVPTNPSCSGKADGRVFVSFFGGSYPYSYRWSNGSTLPALDNLTAGTYGLTITNGLGCELETEVVLVNEVDITVTESITPASCSDDGSISIHAKGGTDPYSYTWVDGRTTSDITDLAPGDYSLTVTDANGCSVERGYTVGGGTDLAISAAAFDADCHDSPTGSIELTATASALPLDFAWSHGATNQNPDGLSAGTYSVSVTDANGCLAVTSATVGQPDPLQLNGRVTDAGCTGGGGISTAPSGGTQPYAYRWADGRTAPSLTDLAPGNYAVTLTDANGCSVEQVYTVGGGTDLAISAAAFDADCHDSPTGSIELTVNASALPLDFAWSHGATNQNPDGLSAGTYSVTVTDANGCSAVTSATVGQPDPLRLNGRVTDAGCTGGGGISTAPSGGTQPYVYRWADGRTAPSLTDLAPGNYALTLTDANGCSVERVYTVGGGTDLAISAAAFDADCHGSPTGSIELTATASALPLDFAWSHGATDQNPDGLSAGTYSVTVTDANGCSAVTSATVGQPDPLRLNGRVTDAGCTGGGGISTAPSGGTQPYAYRWADGRTTPNLNDLVPGTYAVTLTDAGGCSVVDTFTVGGGTDLAISAAAFDADCHGSPTGSIELTATASALPLDFAWSHGATDQNPDGLSAGTYSVTVTDANGCSAVTSATVGQPDPLRLNGRITDAGCTGGGGISTAPSGGTQPYAYRWADGRTTPNLTDLAPGNYAVTLTDTNGCSVERIYTVGGGTDLAISAAAFDADCHDSPTGSIELTVNASALPLDFAWSHGATNQNPDGLSAGTYSVTVTDANGCSAVTSATVGQPDRLRLNGRVTDPGCTGGGKVDLTVGGGTPPYTYRWSNDERTATADDLFPGTYAVTVTDANGCSSADTFTVGGGTDLAIAAVATDVDCHGGNGGSISLTATASALPLDFAWSHGTTIQNPSGLAAGTYAVTVTDANGCSAVTSATVGQPDPLRLEERVTDAGCTGGGGISTVPSGGTQPYTYRWADGRTTPNLTDLVPGTYALTLTDASGCSLAESFTVGGGTDLTIAAVATDADCHGSPTGSIELTVTASARPLKFAWSHGATDQNPDGLSAGTYSVTVTDANGCSAVTSATVEQPDPLQLNGRVTDAGCTGGGGISTVPSGGTQPYTYRWADGRTTPNLTDLVPGTYALTLTDASGCSLAESFTVGGGTDLTIAAVATDADCHGSPTGSIELTVTASARPLKFAWSHGATDQNPDGLSAGTYSVTVTDANGCSAVTSATVGQPDPLQLDGRVTDAGCAGGGSVELAVEGGTPPYDYHWSNDERTAIVDDLFPGTYSVTVTDANGCEFSEHFEIGGGADLSVTAVSVPTSCSGLNDGGVKLNVSGSAAPFSFVWGNGSRTQDIGNIGAGSYSVTVTDSNGCSVAAVAEVTEPPPVRIITDEVGNPECYGGTSGYAFVTAEGGDGEYVFNWSDGQEGAEAFALAAATYEVSVSDGKGCSAVREVIVPENAQLSYIDAYIADTAVCAVGTVSIDLSAAGEDLNLQWTLPGGETVSDTRLQTSEAGIHTLRIAYGNDCSFEKDFTVAFAGEEEFRVAFLLPQRGLVDDPTVAIDVSWPVPDSIAWHFTDDIENLGGNDNQQVLSFPRVGTYRVGMEAFSGGCSGYREEIITVFNEPDSVYLDGPVGMGGEILDVELYPNPHDGNFTVRATLNEAIPVTLLFVGEDGNLLRRFDLEATEEVERAFAMPELPPGVHTLIVRTPGGFYHLRHLKVR